MKINNEVKTGIFVVICAAAFVGLAVKVANFSFVKKGYALKTTFRFTGGVKKHAPVCLSGVEVGEVEDIRLAYAEDTTVEVSLWLNEGVKVYLDSKATSSTFGLMGEKYIEIKSGTPASGVAKDGDSIKAEDPFRMEELIDIGKKVASDISKTTDSVTKTSQDIGSVARHVDEIVVESKPKIGGMLDNFGETSENFREFSDDVKYHPWKVLMKGKEVPRADRDRARAERLIAKAKELGYPVSAQTQAMASEAVSAESKTTTTKQNFKPANS